MSRTPNLLTVIGATGSAVLLGLSIVVCIRSYSISDRLDWNATTTHGAMFTSRYATIMIRRGSLVAYKQSTYRGAIVASVNERASLHWSTQSPDFVMFADPKYPQISFLGFRYLTDSDGLGAQPKPTVEIPFYAIVMCFSVFPLIYGLRFLAQYRRTNERVDAPSRGSRRPIGLVARAAVRLVALTSGVLLLLVVALYLGDCNGGNDITLERGFVGRSQSTQWAFQLMPRDRALMFRWTPQSHLALDRQSSFGALSMEWGGGIHQYDHPIPAFSWPWPVHQRWGFIYIHTVNSGIPMTTFGLPWWFLGILLAPPSIWILIHRWRVRKVSHGSAFPVILPEVAPPAGGTHLRSSKSAIPSESSSIRIL